MNRARVEAFTDAVVAIIMTIMVLEFKVPESPRLTAILAELPYLFAYLVSFLFIGVAWYNHHYMFARAQRISKRVYWVNNFWLFTMSLLPVATAWAGEYLSARGPEFFYLMVFFAWSVAYWGLTRALIADHRGTPVAAQLASMPPYRFMNSWRLLTFTLVLAVVVYFYPPACLIATLGELIYMALHTTADSDRVVA
ncbi:TMEM175 family protein [Lacticaseibacillus absianus]|uniref:TMEM175 family protein n=1 Tax=Lacticaseibacillus absianus TaxID=2729623 RepID=UPI0015CE92DE|nr:TMEM175 family protein [Lacticaseibacillus absianus]